MDKFASAYDAVRQLGQVAFLAAAALLPVVNPLGSAAMYLQLTAGIDPGERDRLARLVVFDAYLLLLGSALLGAYVLDFFGISIPAVQLTGGVVVCTIAWPLLMGPAKTADAGQQKAAEGFSAWRPRAFYPLAMPITVGPGSLSVALALGANPARDLRTEAVTVVAHALGILVVALAVYACYRYGDAILRKLGPTGVSVLMRLLAFILLCIGVQIAWNGVHGFVLGAFPQAGAGAPVAVASSAGLAVQPDPSPTLVGVHNGLQWQSTAVFDPKAGAWDVQISSVARRPIACTVHWTGIAANQASSAGTDRRTGQMTLVLPAYPGSGEPSKAIGHVPGIASFQHSTLCS
jgi:multiple antibiotic resistance protein